MADSRGPASLLRRVFGKEIALAAIREQASWMCGRLEQARMQKAGGSGPSRRAKAQEQRSRKAQREYFDTHRGLSPRRLEARVGRLRCYLDERSAATFLRRFPPTCSTTWLFSRQLRVTFPQFSPLN